MHEYFILQSVLNEQIPETLLYRAILWQLFDSALKWVCFLMYQFRIYNNNIFLN